MNFRLKELLREKGMMNVTLAEKVGVNKVTISNFICGKTAPSIDKIAEMAEALDVEFWEMFYTREEMLNTLKNDNVGNEVCCPYCGKKLILSIK